MRCVWHLRAAAAAVAIGSGALAQPAGSDDAAALRPYLTANGLLSRGMDELAAAEYRAFLDANPGHDKEPQARYGLAVALFRQKQLEDAAEQLERLEGLRTFEFAAETRVMLGQCRLAAGRHGDAADAFESVLEDYPDHDLANDAAALRVEALHRAGEHKEAARSAEAFLERWPQSPLAARTELFAGSALMAAGDYAAAATRLERVARSGSGEIPARATLLLAQALHRSGKRDQALARYEAVVQGGDPRLVPDALLGLGSVLLEGNRAREAGQVLDRLLTQFPQSSLINDARLRRARAWFEVGDYTQAAELLARVDHETEGRSDEAAYWLAKCELRTGKPDRAAERLEEALGRFPESRLRAEIAYDRAVALVKAEEPDEARRALDAFGRDFGAHALAPDALYLSASLAHQEDDHGACLEACARFTRDFPGHADTPAVRFLAAESTLLSGNKEGASTLYAELLKHSPADPRADKAAYRLGCVLHELGRAEEAQTHLSRVARGRQTAEEFRPSLLLLGDIAFGRGDWAAAEKLLADFLSFGAKAEGADDALLKLGLARARQGRHADSIQAFDQLLAGFEKSPHRTQARFEKAQALVALKRHDEAVKEFTAVLAADEGSRFAPFAHNHLGAIASSKGERDSAAEHFAKAAALGEGTDLEADALFEQARALAGAGKYAEAERAFTRVVESYPSHRLAPEAAARRAIALSRQDEHQKALAAIEAVERNHGGSLTPALRDGLAYERAWCLRKAGRPADAAPLLKDLAGRAEPELRAHAAVDLAEIESAEGRDAEAAQMLRAVLSQKPPEDLARRAAYQLGVCSFRTGKYDEAAQTMERFLSNASEGDDKTVNASASLVAGESLLKLGKHKQAADHLRRVADGPANDPARPSALLRLGECLAALQHWAESERVFERYLADYGSEELWFQARFGSAWAKENQGRLPEAMSGYAEVVARHQGPTAARAQFQIGECLFAQKRHEDAARELLKVDILYDYPEWSAAALYEAGRCFEAMSNTDQARKQFEQVCEKHGATRWARLAGERLAALKTQPVPGRAPTGSGDAAKGGRR